MTPETPLSKKEMVISKEEFKRLPKGKSENLLLEYFQQNSNKAFKALYLIENLKWSKSQVFKILGNLINSGLIEKKGEYYSLK